MRTYASLLLGAALLLPLPSTAQDAFFNSVNQGAIDYAGTVAVNSALDPDQDLTGVDPDAASPGARFRPSDEVSRQVRQTFVDAFGARAPHRRDHYAGQVESGSLAAPFDSLLERHRLARTDFTDVAAGYFIALWSVIHDRTVSPSEARGAIAQIRRISRGDPATVPPSDAARQAVSEAHGLYAGLVLREQARRAGDPAASERLRRQVSARARGQGMDLQSLELTAQGFRAGPAAVAGAGGD